MKQRRRKRGATRGVANAMTDRRENPKQPAQFPEKGDVAGPTPGTASKGPGSTGARAKRRHKTASPKRNAR